MNLKSILHTFACLATLFASASIAQESQTLRWKFNQGDSYDVALSQATNINSKIDQRVKDVKSKLTLSMSWKIDSVDESSGNATVLQSIDRVQLEMLSLPTGAGKPVNIDTGSDEKEKGFEAKLLKQITPLVGANFEVVMTPRGDIVDVKVPESTLDVLRKAPGSLRLRELMTTAGLKDLFGQSAIVLPESAPDKSTPWTAQNSIETTAGKFDRQHSYQWTGNREDNGKTLADIKLSTTIKPDAAQAETDVRFVSFSGNGDLVMNVTDGHFASSKAVNQMRSEKTYREKVIITTVTNTIEVQIGKK